MTESINDIISSTLDALKNRKSNLSNLIKDTEQTLLVLLAEETEIDNTIAHVEKTTPANNKIGNELSKLKNTFRKKSQGPPVKEWEIRDWILDRQSFTLKELSEHFNRSDSWAQQKIELYRKKGIINTKALRKPGDKTPSIWEYQPPVAFEKEPRQKAEKEALPERSAPVAGTGKWNSNNYSNKEVKKLIDQCRSQGCKIVATGSGHIRVENEQGTVIVSSTPSANSSLHRSRDELKKKLGVKV